MNEHEPAGAYALDALDPAEREAFEQHLRTCISCRREVAEYRETLLELSPVESPLDDRPAGPPAALRDNILNEISRTPQQRAPGSAQSAAPAQPLPPAVAPGSAPGGGEEPMSAPDRAAPQRAVQPARRRSPLLVAVAAISLVIAMGSAGWAVQANQREATVAAQRSEQLALLSEADALTHRFQIEGSPAVLISSAHSGRAMLLAADLPTLPGDRVYQLWTVHDGAGVQQVRPNRTFTAVRDLQLELDPIGDAAALGVTVEPVGGSPEPTLPMVGSAEL